MACNIPYIDRQPFSEAEKDRLAGIHVDIADAASHSKAFKGFNGKFYIKSKYSAALDFIRNTNGKYGKKVTTIQGAGNNQTLWINVLGLSNELQSEIFDPHIYPLFDSGAVGDNPAVIKYLPDEVTEAATVLVKLIRDESDVQSKAGMEALLRNTEKIKAPISKKYLRGTAGQYEVFKTGDIVASKIIINPATNRSSESEMRHLITHELHHAFSVGILIDPTTESEINFSRNIKRLLADAKAKLGKTEGTEDEYEFIAELASNSAFRAKLKEAGFWSRILRLIRNALGMTDQYDAILDQYYILLDQTEDLERLGAGAFQLEEKKEDRQVKKKLDALEQTLSALKQRRERLAQQGLGKQRQQTEKDIDTLEKLMVTKRNEAVVHSLLTIEREMQDLGKAYDTLSKDPAKINPDVLRNMGVQLSSYSVLNSFANQIRRNPLDFIVSEASVPTFLKQLDELRSKVRLMEEDVKELNRQRYAWIIANQTTNPGLNYESIKDNLDVADRDATWWNRWAESPRGVADAAVTTTHKLITQTYATAHQESVAQDFYRKEQKRETVNYKTYDPGSKDWVDNKINFTSVGLVKAEEDYEAWMKRNGKSTSTLADKYAPIIVTDSLKENSNGVRFISPLSQEGKAIMRIPEHLPNKDINPNYAVRQYYETVVLGYLKSQEKILNPSMRPGVRIPSIQRSLFEGLVNEKGAGKFKLFTEKLIQTIRRRSDDTDFRAVNENLEPIHYLPNRYTSRQDGQDGRMSTREVSLDIPASVGIFMEEMRTREGMTKIQSDLEIGKQVLGERQVVKSTKRLKLPGLGGLLSSERTVNKDPETGLAERIEGTESNSYKMIDALMRRLMYGEFKQGGDEVEVFGKKVSVRKSVDFLMKYTGLNIMLGNVAIPLTNLAVGELTMFKEAVGGNLINGSNLIAGQKMYKDVALGSLKDLGEREKKSKFGRMYMYFNPFGHERPADDIGINHNWMKTTLTNLFKSGNNTVEYKLASTTIGAVLDRFKAKDSAGKEVSLYEAIDVDMNGKVKLQPGYSFNGKKEIDSDTINKIRDYTLRVYQLVNGNYTRLDAPGATEYVLGDLLAFMRKWLPEGLAARWSTKKYDESLGQETEGHYISALVAFNNTFTQKGLLPGLLDTLKILTWFSTSDPQLLLLPNELALPQEQQEEIIKLRKAGIKKTLFELYVISGLSLAMFMLADGGDDDSYALYMMARIRREMMTFISPSTAWDVLRSPSVAMNTIGGFHRIINDIGSSGFAVVAGEEQPVYKSGPGKGYNKLLFDIGRQTGVGNFGTQFEALGDKTRLISGGGWK